MRSRTLLAIALLVGPGAFSRAGAAPQSQPTTPPPPKAAAISGIVVDGATKAPIAGALVMLSRVDRQLTDARGRFAFVNLAASPGYTITASKFGYFEGTYGRDALSHAPGAPIALRDGEWVSDLRVTLWRPGVISGSVLDERGEAVAGVWVRALAQIHVAGRTRLAAGPVTLTDDRGIYRIPDLRPGRYLVSVPSVQPSLPGTPLPVSATTYPVTFHPAATAASAATPVELGHGEERSGVDVRLEPVPTAQLSGVVQAPPEALTRLWVRLLPPGLEELGSGSEAASALVAPDGTFALVNVPAGTYTVDVQRSISEITYGMSPSLGRQASSFPPASSPGASGYSVSMLDSGPAGAGFMSRGGSTGTAYWARTTVTAGGRDTSGLSIALRPTIQLRGRVAVEFDPNRPSPTNTSTPSVTADPANGDPALGRPQAGFDEDAARGFVIEGLLAGSYFLRPRGSAGWLIKSAMWNGRDYVDMPFDAATGHDISGVVVTMTNAAASVSGQVRDSQGRNAAGAAVIIFPVERRLWSDYGLQPSRIRSASASTDGAFQLGLLPAGEYYLIALPGADIDAWQRPDFFKSVEAQAVRIAVDWGEKKTQDVVVGGSRGR